MDAQTPQTPPESRLVPGELLRLLRQFPASGEIESPSRQLFWAGCIDEGLVEELNGILGFAYRLTQKGKQLLEEERHTSDTKKVIVHGTWAIPDFWVRKRDACAPRDCSNTLNAYYGTMVSAWLGGIPQEGMTGITPAFHGDVTMDFIDRLSKTVSHGIERARFEADKFQKTSRIQGELNDIKKMLDSKMIEMGHRAYDLFRARQIASPSVAELARTIDELRSELVLKEDELKEAQAMNYVEPEHPDEGTSNAGSQPQHIHIEHEQPPHDAGRGSGPSTQSGPPPQSGPSSSGPSSSSSPSRSPSSSSSSATPRTKACTSCGFHMPQRARYCPRCGHYVGN